uniref:hypothetical protein n=1 Tax=Cephaleuros parasiticus TaxID=173370 RepID=UPI001EDF6B94|nr:hypothetical protein MFQ79_pgp022 [Cephaleuros parasiticus]UIB39040.1 hypothetical protein [Cephaleuros parasiticus]
MEIGGKTGGKTAPPSSGGGEAKKLLLSSPKADFLKKSAFSFFKNWLCPELVDGRSPKKICFGRGKTSKGKTDARFLCFWGSFREGEKKRRPRVSEVFCFWLSANLKIDLDSIFCDCLFETKLNNEFVIICKKLFLGFHKKLELARWQVLNIFSNEKEKFKEVKSFFRIHKSVRFILIFFGLAPWLCPELADGRSPNK